jgi:imidazolonepropionase-like amidohydrolase
VRNLLITAVAMLAPGTAHAETYAIQAGRLIVDAAKPALGPSTLIVTDCRITAIQPGDTAPAGATVHVHLTMNSGEAWYMRFTQKYSVPYATTLGLTHALEMARAGFTTVRDLNGDTSAVIALRDAIDEGRFPGPRIKVSGAALSMIGGHGDRATGPAARTGDGDRHRAPQ